MAPTDASTAETARRSRTGPQPRKVISAPPLVRLVVVANLLTAAALSSAYAFSQPLFNTGDEAAHLDYAYHVWRGQLPVFEDGPLLTPPFGYIPTVQWESHHPPLYYLLEAPFVGPFLDADRYVAAGYAGRAVSTLTACAAVAAVMWAARATVPGNRAAWLAAGTVTAANPTIVALGGWNHNDNLFIVWCALLIGIASRMLRSGPTGRRILAFAFVASAALMTRSTALLVIGVCGGTVGLTALLRRPRDWRVVLALVAAGLLPLAVNAWFYARNVQLTGDLLGRHFGILPGRISRPFEEVAVDPDVWRHWFAIYGFGVVHPAVAAGLLVGLPVAVAALLTARRVARRRALVPEVTIAVIFGSLLVGVVVMQTQYVANEGGASWRYLMPLVPIISIAVACVVTVSRRFTHVLLTGWVALALLPFAASIGRSLVTPDAVSNAPIFPAAACTALAVGVGAAAIAVLAQLVAFSRMAPQTSM